MRKVWLFIVAIFLLVSLYVGVSFYVAGRTTSPFRKFTKTSPAVVSNMNEEVSFKASDGVPIRGWFFKGAGNDVVIRVSGITQDRTDGGYLGLLIAKDLLAQGYSVLVYDNRAHGESGGDHVHFGQDEGNDVLGAVAFLKGKGYKPAQIGIMADSMGSNATLMVIEKLNDVGPIILDSAAARVEPVFAEIVTKENGIPSIFLPGVEFVNKVFYGVDVKKINPIEKLALVPERKFLFLHASGDKTIAAENSKMLLKKSNKASRLVIFNSPDHIATYRTDPGLYNKEVFEFLKEGFLEN
ncbi:alpha/beta hydrolase [Candidatus Curtissbacteria bacterium]|nr:alpha/beta hydrolase [Candidatus Curtissbacteria bacterium]